FRRGDRSEHHDSSARILGDALRRLGLSQDEALVGETLVAHDLLGDLAKGDVEPDEAAARLKSLAARAKMSPRDFFDLQSCLYTADAASYPSIREKAFREAGGRLFPKAPEFEAVRAIIDGEWANAHALAAVERRIRAAKALGKTPVVGSD